MEIRKKILKSLKFFSRSFFVLGQPAVDEEWTREGVMRESNQFRDIILVGKKYMHSLIRLFNVNIGKHNIFQFNNKLHLHFSNLFVLLCTYGYEQCL
jgi:hypothetical protein